MKFQFKRENVVQIRHLGDAKPGGFQTGGFPAVIGEGPDCVADPFGIVPRRRC